MLKSNASTNCEASLSCNHSRARDQTSMAGSCNDNPPLNIAKCNAKFLDSEVREHASNIIVEKMLTAVDSNEHVALALDSATDYKKDGAAHANKINIPIRVMIDVT